jgi:hypothetical protein
LGFFFTFSSFFNIQGKNPSWNSLVTGLRGNLLRYTFQEREEFFKKYGFSGVWQCNKALKS